MERVDILIRNGITPYVVFDGGPLPMKKGTEVDRRACVVAFLCFYTADCGQASDFFVLTECDVWYVCFRRARQKNRELGIQFYSQRNYSEARKYFSRAADVSPYMAHRVIQVRRSMRLLFFLFAS